MRIPLNSPILRVLGSLRKKHWVYLGIGVLTAGLIAGGIILGISLSAPKSPQILEQSQPQPQEVSKFFRSEQFAKLPEQQKVAFVEKIIDNEYYDDKYETMFKGVSKEEGKRLGEQMRPVFMKVINKKLDEYFRMNRQDKDAFMDKFLDRLERGRKRHEAKMKAQGKDPEMARKPKDDDKKPGDKDKPKGPEQFMSKVSPKRRAQYMQFGLDMLSRAKERGISFGPGPGK